jgi:glycine/D-amino acid oxidase-like deaminating enzyme
MPRPMKRSRRAEIAIVGAGIAGIATAYYLCKQYGRKSVLLIDSRPPMSFTSAQSGDNYRNWWPHPQMVEFSNRSIDLMETVAREAANAVNLRRRGYVLVTRRTNIDDLLADLHTGYGEDAGRLIRIHGGPSAAAYSASLTSNWQSAPDGVDVITDTSLIRSTLPALAEDIRCVIHIRRAGDFNSQQLGTLMLERVRAAGGKRVPGHLVGILRGSGFELDVLTPDGTEKIVADVIVNAAGPFARKIALLLGVDLPIQNRFQQKIAFEDARGAVTREMPFAVDLDSMDFDWTDDVRELLADDPNLAWLTGTLPGGRHCRPDGGAGSKWVKLGWAYNSDVSEPQDDLANEEKLDKQFPEIVIRAASSLIPSLATYIESPPKRFSHYGGCYSMTEEN